MLKKYNFLNFNKLSKSFLKLLFPLCSLIYLLLSVNLPISLPTFAIHDDAFFWNAAQQIVQGHWLGSYDHMTLIKGPAFSIFLAINAILGTPITLSIALFYLLSCYLVINNLNEIGFNKYWLLIVFVITLFHPLFDARAIRDSIYPALLLIVLSGMIKLTFMPVEKKCSIKYPIFYGLMLGFFWITREEGVWIVPSFLLLVLCKIWNLKKQKKVIRPIFYRYVYFLLSALVLVNTIALINFYKYGKYEVVDFKSKEFNQALKSLNSVSVGEEIAYLPVPFAKRQSIYSVSPSFSELKEYFENTGKGWTKIGCQFYPHTCGDYSGGSFVWALRDAVAGRGYYKNPIMAAEFYKKVSSEITTACNAGLIICKEPLVPFSFAPNIPVSQLKLIPEKFFQGLKLAMLLTPLSKFKAPDNSYEPLVKLRGYWQFLGYPYALPISKYEVSTFNGWFIGSDIKDWIVFNCSDVKIMPERIPSPDLAIANKLATQQRFFISIPNKENCTISTVLLPTDNISVKMIDNTHIRFNLGNGILHIDSFEDQASNYNFKNKAIKFKNKLIRFYVFLIPKLAILAMICYFYYLILIFLRKKSACDIFIIATTLWCLFFSRIFLLVLVDISSFVGIHVLYMAPAFPILCLASFTSLQLLFKMTNLPSFRIFKFRN